MSVFQEGNEITLADLRQTSAWRLESQRRAGVKPFRPFWRSFCGPYLFTVGPVIRRRSDQRDAFTGYLSSDYSEMAEGSSVRLRVRRANDYLDGTRLANTTGYYMDDECFETMEPVIAILPAGRGYLAGWTMGQGMSTRFDASYIYRSAREAANGAHSYAEAWAETEREYQRREQERAAAAELSTEND